MTLTKERGYGEYKHYLDCVWMISVTLPNLGFGDFTPQEWFFKNWFCFPKSDLFSNKNSVKWLWNHSSSGFPDLLLLFWVSLAFSKQPSLSMLLQNISGLFHHNYNNITLAKSQINNLRKLYSVETALNIWILK